MNKDTNKNIDDIFKNGFENFQQAPPKQNWEQIEDGIDTDIDQQFKSKLHTLKVSPQPKVWKNIEEELPLHPTARRYFSWMTKIAAILVIGMLLAILSDQQKQDKTAFNSNQIEQTEMSSSDANSSNSMSGLFGESNKNKDFVFEVEKDKFSSKRSRKYDKEAAEKEAMKNLLQFILDDDEDLALLTDSLVINKSLEPADNLDEAMALAIKDNETAEVIDLEIKIPLIVVETEQEAASLIQLYESSHAPVQRLD